MNNAEQNTENNFPQELDRMRHLRKQIELFDEYARTEFLTDLYPEQRVRILERVSDYRKELENIRKARHKRAQQKYDQGNGREKNRIRAKKNYHKKKLAQQEK